MEPDLLSLSRKKPGPLPGPPRSRYNILLEEELGEWGKRQPGGLSELVRRLLREERARQERRPPPEA